MGVKLEPLWPDIRTPAESGIITADLMAYMSISKTQMAEWCHNLSRGRRQWLALNRCFVFNGFSFRFIQYKKDFCCSFGGPTSALCWAMFKGGQDCCSFTKAQVYTF